MTGPAVPDIRDGQDRGAGSPALAGIGRAAALIAALTILARLLGLVRTIVFAKTVGATCLGTAYVTANAVPNIIYYIALGGALTSIMVPVLARPADRSAADPAAAAEVRQTSSALLTWTMVILVPVSVAIALAACLLASLLNPANGRAHCAQASLVTVTGHMLAAFAPQILLYGLAVVLYGILQAHRRFAAPALAPVISSVVVIIAYIAFVPLGASHVNALSGLPVAAELTLSVGTTVGVAALGADCADPGLAPADPPPADAAIPGCRRPAGARSCPLRNRRAGGRGPVAACRHRAGKRARVERGVRPVPVRLAGVRGRLRGAGDLDRGSARFLYSPRVTESSSTRLPPGSTRAVLLMSFLGAALVAAVAIPAAHFLASKPWPRCRSSPLASRCSRLASRGTGWWPACPVSCWRPGAPGRPRSRWRVGG